MRRTFAAFALLALAGLAWSQIGDTRTKDMERLQGSWAAVTVQGYDGKPLADDDIAETRLLIKGNKFVLTGKGYKLTGTFTLDPSNMPKTIDVVLDENQISDARLQGIYEINGDMRRSCFAMPGLARPTAFMHGTENYLIFEWKPMRIVGGE